MAVVFVSVGSNINKHRNVITSIDALRRHFGHLHLSPVYESEAVGFIGDSFYNMVVSFVTLVSPRRVAETLRDIERMHARRRVKNPFSARTLDLDMLIYEDIVMKANAFRLPHPDIEKYAFVLRPLAALAGHRVHPVLGDTYAQMWARYPCQEQGLQEVALPELR